jgi:hypothetical protein
MGYVMLSDRVHSAPAIMRAGLEATGLWAMSLTYCARHDTTAVPPLWVREQPHGRRCQRRLLEVGLWHATEQGLEPALEERGIPLARVNSLPSREPISQEMRSLVFERDEGVCQLCGQAVEGPFHVDHIQPFSLGGPTIESNLQLAHPTCNIRKGNRV